MGIIRACVWYPTVYLSRCVPVSLLGTADSSSKRTHNTVVGKECETFFFFSLGKFQVEGKASVQHGVSAESGGAGSKIGLCSVSIPLSLRPPPRVDNHNSRLSFYTLLPVRVQLQLWPGRAFHDSARAATQTAKVEAKILQELLLQVSVLPRKRDRRRACVIGGDTLRSERETESCVKAHRRRKKPDLLSPKRKKLTADVCSQILPLPPIMETHAKICSACRVFFPMHTFTNTRINFSPRFTYLDEPTRRHAQA